MSPLEVTTHVWNQIQNRHSLTVFLCAKHTRDSLQSLRRFACFHLSDILVTSFFLA